MGAIIFLADKETVNTDIGVYPKIWGTIWGHHAGAGPSAFFL